MTTLSNFTIDSVFKSPINTMGVSGMFYFGRLDGIEVGSPCDTESEAMEEVVRTLNGEKPYRLEDLLQEWEGWLGERIAENKRPDAVQQWRENRAALSQLISKIKEYKAANFSIQRISEGSRDLPRQTNKAL